VNAWLNNVGLNFRLTLRDRQALFFIYLLPVLFLFIFVSIFGRFGAGAVGGTMAGLLCISAMASGFFGLSVEMVVARERGILRRYQLAPISPLFLISGQMVSSFFIALSSLILQLTLAQFAYRLKIAGSYFTLLLMLSAGVLAFLALGFLVASVAENAKTAQVMGNILFFPLMFLGGAAIPLQIMPEAMQKASRLFPSRYMVEGVGSIVVGGEGLSENLANFAVLAITFIASLLIASKLFRWSASERLTAAQKTLAAAVCLIFIIAFLWAGN
jgi:ABC-2 type transport system permease protein